MNKILISSRQMFAFTVLCECGTTILAIAASATAIAKQDAWIAVILVTICGAAILWVNMYLGGLYPNKTIIEIIQLIFGKWVGGFIIINYVFMCFLSASQVIWYVGNFFTTTYMPETPMYAINIMFGTVLIIAMLYELEAIMRSAEIFLYIVCIVIGVSMFMVIPNIKVNNLFPVFENGFTPIAKSSFILFSYTGMKLILLNIFYPKNIKDIKKAKISIFKGYLIAMMFVLATVVMSILVLGPTITANSNFPVFELAKEINVGIMFTRLEALTIVGWLLTLFITTIAYYYNAILGISQLLGIKEHKRIAVPLGLLMIVLSEFAYTNVPYRTNWDNIVWPVDIFMYGVLLPLVLLAMYFVRCLRPSKKV